MDAIPELTVAQVAARLGDPSFHVYDCNGAGRYRRSHVAGALHVNPYDFAAADLHAAPTDTLVFYCAGPG